MIKNQFKRDSESQLDRSRPIARTMRNAESSDSAEGQQRAKRLQHNVYEQLRAVESNTAGLAARSMRSTRFGLCATCRSDTDAGNVNNNEEHEDGEVVDDPDGEENSSIGEYTVFDITDSATGNQTVALLRCDDQLTPRAYHKQLADTD